jgi:hypothetical protein
MKQRNERLSTLYNALSQKDFQAVRDCYHAEATFDDEVFSLRGAAVPAMWQMLLARAKDFKLTYHSVVETENRGSAIWEAYYTFSATGRAVHNIIRTEVEFKDGKIFRQQDSFNFWRWSRQAFGVRGVLLGWTPLLRKKVQQTAMTNLQKFIVNKE